MAFRLLKTLQQSKVLRWDNFEIHCCMPFQNSGKASSWIKNREISSSRIHGGLVYLERRDRLVVLMQTFGYFHCRLQAELKSCWERRGRK